MAILRRERRPARRGLATTEMAILLPFMGLMFVTALDFCRAYFVTQTLQSSAYCGVLYASGTAKASSAVTTTAAAQNAVLADAVNLSPPLQTQNITVTTGAQSATVTVQYTFQPITPIWGSSGTLLLQRQATMNLAPVAGN